MNKEIWGGGGRGHIQNSTYVGIKSKYLHTTNRIKEKFKRKKLQQVFDGLNLFLERKSLIFFIAKKYKQDQYDIVQMDHKNVR